MDSITQKEANAKGFYKLSWLQRIGFGSGDLAQNFIFQTVMQYFSIFYLTVFGFDPGKVAVMVFIPPVLNIFLSMWLGTFVDKHNPKWGKYRSYLIIGGIPLTIFAILCFWDGFPGSKLLYAFITYTVLYLLYTVVSLPYGAIFASLTRDSGEMAKLTSVRMILANLGGLAVAFLIPTIVRALSPSGKFNTPDSAHAWLITMTIFALVGLALLFFCFSQSKERVVIKNEKTPEVKMSDMWTEIKQNRPLRIVALFIFTAFAMMSIYNAAGAYYMTYNLNAQEYAGLFQGIGFLPAFIFLPMLPAIIKAIGKKKMFYLFLVIAIVGMAMLYIVSVRPALRSQIWIILLAQFVKSTGIIIATGYMWALVPEVISYGEHVTGRRISGTVNAVIGIVFQLGLAVGLFIPNMILKFVGFNKDADIQSASAQQGILWLVAVIPILLLIVEMFIISKYELEDEVIDKINREIEAGQLENE
jgi:GPH family glycoside/pentoside/hexuronide:cation symporter